MKSISRKVSITRKSLKQLQFLFATPHLLKPTHIAARLLGLKQLVELDCNDPTVLSISSTQPVFEGCVGTIEECKCHLYQVDDTGPCIGNFTF